MTGLNVFKRLSTRVRRMSSSIIVFAIILALPVSVFGQFVAVGPTYQTPFTKVLPVRSQSENGIFILVAENKVPVQLFDLQSFSSPGTKSFFLKYSPNSLAFSELITPAGSVRVTGSFVLNLGETRVTLDTVNNIVPYLSIVDRHTEIPSLLSFSGTDVVLNTSGPEAGALFEAQVPSLAGTILPYKLGEDGVVTLSGDKRGVKRVGVVAEISNRCREQSAVILGVDESKELLAKLDEESINTDWLRGVILKNLKVRHLEDLILLQVSDSAIIGFDYNRNRFLVIREIALPSSKPGLRALCSQSVVKVG